MYFKKMMRGLAFLALALVLNSCVAAEPRVPGHKSYCIKPIAGPNLGNSDVQSAYYIYGPWGKRFNGVSRLTEFYTLTVHWTTKEGDTFEEVVPVKEIMPSIKTKKHWLRGESVFHEPCLQISIFSHSLMVDYVIGEMIDKGPSPDGGRYVDARDIRYPVFHKQYDFKERK